MRQSPIFGDHDSTLEHYQEVKCFFNNLFIMRVKHLEAVVQSERASQSKTLLLEFAKILHQ